MRAFQPSPAFVAFFNQMIAAAEAPVTPGSFTVTIPTFADPQEQAFANTILLGLAQQIDAMRKSITPTTTAMTIGQAAAAAESGDAAAQALYEQMLWQQASSNAP